MAWCACEEVVGAYGDGSGVSEGLGSDQHGMYNGYNLGVRQINSYVENKEPGFL